MSAVGNRYHLVLQNVKYKNINKIQGQGVVSNIVCYSCDTVLGLESVCGHWVDELLCSCNGWMFPGSQDGPGCKKWQDVQGIFGKDVPKPFIAALRKTPVSVLVLFHKVIKILNHSRWGMKMKCLHIF